MKTLYLLLAVAVLTAGTALAGETDYAELLRQDLRTEKTKIVTEGMQLTPEEGEKFWPVYREYEKELANLWDERLANIKQYAEHYTTMDDDTANDLMEKSMDWREDRLKLVKKTYKDMKKAVGPIKAARFAQIDGVLQNLVDLQIASELPLATHGIEGASSR